MKTVPEVKYFPEEGFDNGQVDVMNMRKVYFTGLYERSVVLSNGTVRTYKAYVPSTAHYGDESFYVAVPDGVDTATFLAETGWLDIAEKEEHPYILFALEPADQTWRDADTELEYVGKAFDDMNGKTGGGFRNLVFTSDFNWRWMGYGRGGEMIMRYALRNPMLFASLAVVGDLSGIDSQTLEQSAKICYTNSRNYTYTEWPNSKIPVPVWLVGCENEAVVNYWKTANECTEELELADGWLYKQNPLSANLMTFDQKVGQVKCTQAAASFTDPLLAEKLNKFLYAFSRCGMGSPYGNMLYPTTHDSFFKRDTVISDGMEREWYVHVPTCYDPARPMPLVIYFHGHGQGGLIGMRQGGWWQYGEEKGFVTVCPSGSLPKQDDNQLPLIGWHTGMFMKVFDGLIPNRCWADDEERHIENRFVRAMLEKLYTQYNIDKSRMYITGQSNGCVMTQMMSEMGEDLFAAAASTGMPILIAESSVPNFNMGGQFDICPVVLDDEHQIIPEEVGERYRKAAALQGADPEAGGYFRNGIFENIEWCNAEGMPVYRFCTVNGQAHSWRQNVCKTFWDEWFCRYSKDPETGKIRYMGK